MVVGLRFTVYGLGLVVADGGGQVASTFLLSLLGVLTTPLVAGDGNGPVGGGEHRHSLQPQRRRFPLLHAARGVYQSATTCQEVQRLLETGGGDARRRYR
jgi:hypothetical protein